MKSLPHSIGAATLSVLFIGTLTFGEVAGRRADEQRYTSHDRGTELFSRHVQIEMSLDGITFGLTSWKDRYRIVRVRLRNLRKDALVLSSAEDEIIAVIHGKRVRAHLQLSKSDPDLWNALDLEVRKDLAYPKTLPKEDSTVVYVFFPAEQLQSLPEFFEWRLASLDETVRIVQPARAKD